MIATHKKGLTKDEIREGAEAFFARWRRNTGEEGRPHENDHAAFVVR